MVSKIELGKVLKRELKSRGISLQKLSKEVGIPATTLHGWCEGLAPSGKNLVQLKVLADYLNLTLESILFNTNDNFENKILFSSSFVDEGREYRVTVEKNEKE